MGSGRDKRKKANPKAPGAGREKTERKTAAAEEKRRRRAERGGADEDDIDALLARVKLADAGGGVSVEEGVEPPSRRVNASLTHAAGPRAGELLLYGGEWYDNAKTRVYGELYRFDTAKRRWALVRSPGAPPPRSAHQAVAYKHYLFVFGGEFTSPNQERFLHYKDLWRLDLTNWSWEQLTLRGGPSARSGHRMVVYKSKIVLFGGFYDAAKETKYYNDLWELDLETLKWSALGAPGALCPPPRSGCQLALHAEAGTLFVYGGYRKEPGDDDTERGVALADCWALDLSKHTWERVKKQGIAPGPRSGFALAVHRTRAVLFGGVVDHESKGGEVLVSEFYNELYTFAMDTRRWFPLALRPPPAAAASAAADTAAASATPATPAPAAPAPADGAAQRAAVRIQAAFRGYAVRKVLRVYRVGGAVGEMLYAPALGFAPPRGAPAPFGRIAAATAVVGNSLWMYGGMVEFGDTEITFDDVWRLDLAKLTGWECVHAGSVTKEQLRAAAEAAGGAAAAESSDEWASGSEDEDDA